MTRIGILGGTFNPIHKAHLQMAVLAKETLGLDRVLLMVAGDPPHKEVDGHVAAEKRLFMARLASEGIEGVEACDLELRRGGKSYTAHTLEALAGLYPGAELFLIVGSDMLRDIPDWYEPERVLSLAQIVCVPRKGENATDWEAAKCIYDRYRETVTLLPGSVDKISSTEIRDRLEDGLPVDTLLRFPVERYCYEEGMYFPSSIQRTQQRLRTVLKPSRYRHTMGCVEMAVGLAARWGGNPQKARLAALLHDCAKHLPMETLSVLSGDDTEIGPVLHAFAGAVLAQTTYGVSDTEILRAIRLHSTGDASMTLLDEILYLADLTEPNRTFPGVDQLREALALGPDGAMLYSLARTKAYVETCGGAFHPASMRAITYFENKEAKN